MKGKIWLVIFLIFAILGLFLLSPRGKTFREKYLNDKISKVGSYLRGITSRTIPKGQPKAKQENKLEITLSGVDPVLMNGQEFDVKDASVDALFKFESALIDGNEILLKKNVTGINIESMTGAIVFFDDKMKISGKTNRLWLNDIGFSKEGTDFIVVGVPDTYILLNIKKDALVFPQISGRLTATGMGTISFFPNDKLELYGFEGKIEQKNDLVYITGTISYMKLNNVYIGASI